MSAPKTDIEAQKRHHRWPLLGIALSILAGVVIAAAILFAATDDPGAPLSDGTRQSPDAPSAGAAATD